MVNKTFCDFSVLDEHVNTIRYKTEISIVERDILDEWYSLDDASEIDVFHLHLLHKIFNNSHLIRYKSIKAFVLSEISQDSSEMRRSVRLIGNDTNGGIWYGAIYQNASYTQISKIMASFYKTVDFNEFLLEMECLKERGKLAFMASLDAPFEVTERFLFDLSKEMLEIPKEDIHYPKVYEKMDQYALNSELSLKYYPELKGRKSLHFCSEGKKYLLMYGG